ncbi:MAG: 4Fe-4S binding protein [Ignavibacteria bacterium]|jgi:ferredoxin|nr:4Fe-4S binding protein [Ignavibacteria bacterium]
MENKNNNPRREFIKKFGLMGIGICAGGTFLNSCTKNVLSPFRTGYSINSEKCIGCGVCVSECYYKAIVLPFNSKYHIEPELCIECGECEPQCKYQAIFISTPTYNFLSDKCIGCGKCIEKCVNEGNCITYEKETYTIRNKCKPGRCEHQCEKACEYGAITIADKCVIDTEKCQKCGKCVAACPYNAINPAKVTKDEAKCTHCGQCYEVCTEFNAIEKIKPDGYTEPHIDQTICTACGDCRTFCTKYDAIKYKLEIARIDSSLCVDCGKCVSSCEQNAIELIEI